MKVWSPRIFANNTNKYFWCIACVYTIVILCACSPKRIDLIPTPPDASIYLAEGVEHNLIQFIWLEIPHSFEPGPVDVRLFVAKSEPPEPIIPNPTDLKCILESSDEYAALGPETIEFEINPDGTFSGSYTFKACPECIECYMNWDYTLEMTGMISEELVSLDIAVVHIGLNVQGSYLQAELETTADSSREPTIHCNGEGKCSDIQFVSRGD